MRIIRGILASIFSLAPCVGPALAQTGFPSPEAGVAALAAAVAGHDERRMIGVLGPAARPLLRSGDAVADREARDRFTAAFAQAHEILRPAPDRAVLQLGPDAWPLPIPLVLRQGVWRFDAQAGAQALVDRRVGRNELDTIEALRGMAEAQAEYARGAGRRAYARRFFSTPGQRDGLYWPNPGDEPESPLGPLAAAAAAGGYTRGDNRGDGRPQPFQGYYFRMLEAQGPAAPGGALEYVLNGRMIGGFAILAWPAQYGASGIQSFMVSHQGQVFQRDLGPETARLARAIARFDPGPGWAPVPAE